MFHVRDDYSADGPITQVGVGWFNKVGKFLNNLIGSGDIILEKYDGDTPSIIKLRDTPITMGTATSPDAQQGADISTDSAGESFLDQSGFAPTLQSLQSEWMRGDTDPTTGEKVGTMLTVCTGVKKHPQSSYYYAHFANLYFDENGMLAKVETARHSYRVQ